MSKNGHQLRQYPRGYVDFDWRIIAPNGVNLYKTYANSLATVCSFNNWWNVDFTEQYGPGGTKPWPILTLDDQPGEGETFNCDDVPLDDPSYTGNAYFRRRLIASSDEFPPFAELCKTIQN